MFGKITEEKVLKKIIKNIKKTMKVRIVPLENLVTELDVSSVKAFEIYFKFEQSFKICFDENEITLENLNDLHLLTKLILSKMQ